jgi:hypothetical protein
MEHYIKLIRQPCPKIVTLPLGFGAVNHTDCALGPRRALLLRHHIAVIHD